MAIASRSTPHDLAGRPHDGSGQHGDIADAAPDIQHPHSRSKAGVEEQPFRQRPEHRRL